MHKVSKYVLLAVLVVLLILVRFFETQLFYDPYLDFFKSDYLYIDSPRREALKLTFSTVLRYFINTVISLAILFVLFRDKSIIKFSTIIYTLSLIILLVLFLYFVINPKQEDYYLFFNIRRFLIQPLILLLLIPAFYYYKQQD
ncbi:exosortase F system-associated membrane protein [Oceanihabitans sediminis]|uniref:Exosortase F system-associated protein n=1 Tax=Oceanihabitans sediminis TaxID=1812012 RepID=A0A368P815_9FLAO|nr:exosortase F system-associated protein [Oceanihabitans sediminis]MDX1278363.1 exosortase F system-associated protein [Oceanihabitans sediminis]MDX1772593.1 exosortase F system-associated protein [Oceanihabitans sediminis]RBP34260.1 exosortase F-associated protein [Oceanihabitans sediminis]RCU57949.1 exosortase F system-associated protein [Oceanihabitans sediminis]